MDSFIYKYESTGKNVIITKLKEGCYVVVSFVYTDDKRDAVEPRMGFVYYGGGNVTAEWCPPYGPISINTKCDEEATHSRDDFFLGKCTNDWTQLAVDEQGMADMAINNIEGIYSILKEYCQE